MSEISLFEEEASLSIQRRLNHTTPVVSCLERLKESNARRVKTALVVNRGSELVTRAPVLVWYRPRQQELHPKATVVTSDTCQRPTLYR